MNCNELRTVVVAALASASLGSAARADILIDNFGEPLGAVTIMGFEDPDIVWGAQGFSTPYRARLNSLELVVGELAGAPEIVAELRTGDEPTGPLVAVLPLPAISAGPVEPAGFTPAEEVVLEAGQRYWIVLYTVTGGSFGWAYAGTTVWAGDGSLHDYWYSFDQGGQWQSYGGDNPYYVRIDVTPVTVDCPADLNGDGLVDFTDYLEFLNLYDAADPRVDFNQDGLVDFSDYLEFLNLYDAGC